MRLEERQLTTEEKALARITEIRELDTSKQYIITVDCGNMTTEEAVAVNTYVKSICDDKGIKALYVAAGNNLPKITVTEVKEYLAKNDI